MDLKTLARRGPCAAALFLETSWVQRVRIYIGLYAITNNYCVARVRNDFYLPATLIQRYSIDYAVLISKAGMQKWLLRSLVQVRTY